MVPRRGLSHLLPNHLKTFGLPNRGCISWAIGCNSSTDAYNCAASLELGPGRIKWRIVFDAGEVSEGVTQSEETSRRPETNRANQAATYTVNQGRRGFEVWINNKQRYGKHRKDEP